MKNRNQSWALPVADLRNAQPAGMDLGDVEAPMIRSATPLSALRGYGIMIT